MSARHALLSTAVLFCSLLLAPGAHAAEQQLAAAAAPAPRVFSLTVSPAHLTGPVLELTGEYRVVPKFGLAAIAGGGKMEGYSVYEVGGQARYYLVGDFEHGMEVGGEALYLKVGSDSGQFSAAAEGLAVGPFLGYKFVASFGLTFEAQLGFYTLAVKAEAQDKSSGLRGEAEDSDSGPLLNINLGWSF